MTPEEFGNPWMANLKEIGLPDPVSQVPTAPGWYVLAGLLLLAAAALAWRRWRRWQRDAYRREALTALNAVEAASRIPAERTAALARLPELLKRTALSAYPRERVASLTGDVWLEFLDRTSGPAGFPSTIGQRLSSLAYGVPAAGAPTDEEVERLLATTRAWIRRHRVTEG